MGEFAERTVVRLLSRFNKLIDDQRIDDRSAFGNAFDCRYELVLVGDSVLHEIRTLGRPTAQQPEHQCGFQVLTEHDDADIR